MISPPNTHPSSSPQTLAAVTYPISHLPPESPPCGGRLQFFIGAWSKITQDPWVLQVVRGYQLDFSSHPPLHRPRYTQPALARDQKQGMEAEIQSLLEKQAIVRLTPPLSPGFYSSVFVVPKKDGGWRPIINLRELNRSDWRFLRFSWEEEYYQFKTLPFGLTSAPYVFTKLLRPVAALFRQAGLRILVYLDDWLLLASDPDLLKDQGEYVSSNLQSLRFLLNHKKCIMVPTQSIEFLGFIIDSRRMTLSLPAVKVDKIHKECRHILNLSEVTGRQLSHIIGLMTSVLPAIHPAPLHYRALQCLRLEALGQKGSPDYDSSVKLSSEAVEDLQWWIHSLRHHNGRPIYSPEPTLVLELDASKKGWGAHCRENGISTGGPWTREESQAHINWLELKAAFLATQTFVKHPCHVQIFLDNQVAVAYINQMGATHSRQLCKLAVGFWDWCMKRQITIHAEHLPGKLNVLADYESHHLSDCSNWKLNPETFLQLNARFGPFTINLFASHWNKQVNRFSVGGQIRWHWQWMLWLTHGVKSTHMHFPPSL